MNRILPPVLSVLVAASALASEAEFIRALADAEGAVVAGAALARGAAAAAGRDLSAPVQRAAGMPQARSLGMLRPDTCVQESGFGPFKNQRPMPCYGVLFTGGALEPRLGRPAIAIVRDRATADFLVLAVRTAPALTEFELTVGREESLVEVVREGRADVVGALRAHSVKLTIPGDPPLVYRFEFLR